MTDDESRQTEPWSARYPPADITASEFEDWTAELFRSAGQDLANLRVQVHERVKGVDGSFDFDATVRFEWSGIDFLVLVEAKRHSNPIKREVVQALHSKMDSVGAHKGVIVATAPYQRGALEFARHHGIALVSLTEGRFTFETKSMSKPPPLSRERARELFGLPVFVGHRYQAADGQTIRVTLISSAHPEYVRELLLPDGDEAM